MLSARLHTEQIARLLLALMLVCNLTLCVSWLGLFGAPRVNVLELNLALDGTPPQRAE